MTTPIAAEASGRPVILLTNDDGAHAPGLLAMRERLSDIGRVVIVAPDRELSGVGHGISLHHPLRTRSAGDDFHILDGTPTDCVHFGISHILEERPSLVVSGLNRGGNLGDDVTYSGTVAGAMEGVLLGVASVAASHVSGHGIPDADRLPMEEAATIACRIIRLLVGSEFPERTLLNINIPAAAPVRGVRTTFQGRRRYRGGIVSNRDPRGRSYYWIGGEPEGDDEEGSDQAVVAEGYVSVTPLNLDLTDRSFLPSLRKLLDESGRGERI